MKIKIKEVQYEASKRNPTIDPTMCKHLEELYFGNNPEVEELPTEIRQLPKLVAYGTHGVISRNSTNFMPIVYCMMVIAFIFFY